MDYKQKIKEYLNSDIDVLYKNMLLNLFPELKESEDGENKRISKEITHFLKQNNGWNRVWLAWLEKQGEQKPFDYENANIQQKDFAPKVEPKFKIGDIVQYITDSTDRRKIVEVDTLCNMYHTDNDSLPIMFEVEDEWKVVVNAEDVEQNPAWSEEDEYLLGETIQHLEELIRIEKVKHCGIDVQYYQRDIDWLKSIKDRCTWKPSDEQMDVLLSEVSAWTKGCPKQKVLESLYNDLKKLKL